MLVLEMELDLDGAACEVPDAPAEIGLAVSALRLATPGAVAAGAAVKLVLATNNRDKTREITAMLAANVVMEALSALAAARGANRSHGWP